uniref:Serine (or cysteine) peptidase inhibitor, clade B, member 9b n=2 Tax=Rattus norvegicus TaxID=10116 RepID=M0R455_RAT
MNTLSEANGTFAIHLLKMLCQSNPSENVCYSPVSISATLAMVLLGAKGQTQVQISQASHLSKKGDIHRGFQLLFKKLNKSERYFSLRMANGIFVDKTCEVLPTFKESCLRFYNSEMEQLSFAEAAEESRKHVNTWVSKQTEGKIPELLPDDSVDFQTRLVLVNALYLKATWGRQFDEGSTREMPFKINKNETRPVQMMYQEGIFCYKYVKEVPASLLMIPYKGDELCFLVLLPDESVDISKVEEELTFEKLTAWTQPDTMSYTHVEVFLPKFKLEEDYDLKSLLQRLGIVDAFEETKADLSAMAPERNLCVSKFVHKSVVEVNEKGTEAAAAASSVNIVPLSSGGSFCADHPFLFFIRHNKTNSILFCGRFSSP